MSAQLLAGQCKGLVWLVSVKEVCVDIQCVKGVWLAGQLKVCGWSVPRLCEWSVCEGMWLFSAKLCGWSM